MGSAAKPNELTRQVMVGAVPVGGGAPVAVQSMLNMPAQDVAANLAQIERLAEAGCEIVRMAIPRRDCLDAFAAVCEASPLPVVADVHFDAHIAIQAAWRGAAKLRINPGNIGGLEATDAVIDAAGEAGIPIRIGVNAGSLDDALAARDDLTLPEKLAASAAGHTCGIFEGQCGFHDIVVSAKAHDVRTTIDTYRLLAAELPGGAAAHRRHRGGHRVSRASSSARVAWASFWKRVSATRCASRSRTIPWWKCGLAGRCSAHSICAAAPPSSSAAPPAVAAR